MNTSKPFISKKCLKHANIGSFKYSGPKPIIQKNGGHGEDNINYLKSKKIDYEVIIEYNNGVRKGNISIHKVGKQKNKGEHAWFPKNWTAKTIKAAGQYVMSLKKNKKRKDRQPYTGYYKGVKVGTYTNKGFVSTIFPWYIQKGGTKK